MTGVQDEGRPPAEPAADPAAVVNNGPPLIVAHGIGGRIELYDDCIRIRRDGYVNYLLNWLAARPAFIDTTIPLERVSSFDIIKPVLFNDFAVVAYPGSPPLTGRSLVDAMAEGSLLMNFFDNREFYAIKRAFQKLTARRSPDVQMRRSALRRARPRPPAWS
jgi:hypothetical protein